MGTARERLRALLDSPPVRTFAAQRWLFGGLASGALFVWIFASANPLPKDAYTYRDDAIITLSHARNFVEYGSIGVDAAGARVEGYSTPLQFAVFGVVYAITRCSYETFLDWQVQLCTFLLGFLVVQLFRPRWLLGLTLSAAIAFSLAKAVRFIGWHGSGMENAFTHVLFAACVVAAWYSIESGRVRAWMPSVFWLATTARIESILHVAPLLAVWSAGYFIAHRNWRALRASAWVVAGFGLVQLARLLYFGDLRPNTAFAEGIDIFERLRALRAEAPTERNLTAAVVRQIVLEHRGYLALLCMPLLAVGNRRTSNVALVCLLASLFATAVAHPVLFGPARLDPVRTTSHLALVAPLLIATQWAALESLRVRTLTFAGLAVAIALYGALEPPAETYFCCAIGRADAIADYAQAHAQREALPRPSLANPDLGKLSYKKQFLMVDLGMLASPPLARLRSDPRAIRNYLLELAQPDFIELHGGWACHYAHLREDPRFDARYVRVPDSKKLHLRSTCRGAQAGLWFRSDMAKDSGSRERQLVDDLRRHLDRDRVARELASCRGQPGRLACAYVSRSVYRFLPELARSDRIGEFVALFRRSPSYRYDRSILQSRESGRWYRGVVRFARTL